MIVVKICRHLLCIRHSSKDWKKIYDQPRHHIKKERLYFANKGPSS